jgi:hypothetical protein
MRTAQECLWKARQCEDLARDSIDRVNRDMMLETAQYWRQLAKNAERDEKRDRYPLATN